MRIVELSDYSMVIMKDSEDAFYNSVGDIYRKAEEAQRIIGVTRMVYDDHGFYCEDGWASSDSYIYSGGRLVLFFKDKIESFKVHDKVVLSLLACRRATR